MGQGQATELSADYHPSRNHIVRTFFGFKDYEEKERICPYCKGYPTERVMHDFELQPYEEVAKSNKVRVYECHSCTDVYAALKHKSTCELSSSEKTRFWYAAISAF